MPSKFERVLRTVSGGFHGLALRGDLNPVVQLKDMTRQRYRRDSDEATAPAANAIISTLTAIPEGWYKIFAKINNSDAAAYAAPRAVSLRIGDTVEVFFNEGSWLSAATDAYFPTLNGELLFFPTNTIIEARADTAFAAGEAVSAYIHLLQYYSP